MTNSNFLRGHYQNAYVTRDIGAAMALIDRRYGKLDWITFAPDMVLTTPEGEKETSVRAALGWTGWLQIELIEPVSGYVDPYLSVLPADPNSVVPSLHHIAVRRDDLDAMRAEIAALGLPLAFEGGVPGLAFVYLDARDTLGHYLEYMWATPEGWAMTGWPEGRPVL
jgi:hypothetical protein